MRDATQRDDEVPDGVAFPRPPLPFTDRAGRTIEIRTHGHGERDPLVEMYDALDDEDRAQGLPPATTEGIRS